MQEVTKILHQLPIDPLTGAISVPIYQPSTFIQESPGIHKSIDYVRSNNPTLLVLEKLIGNLENGCNGLAFATGTVGLDRELKLLKNIDKSIAIEVVPISAP